MDTIFERLISVIQQQQQIITSIASKIEQIESIGGGGSATIADYTPDTNYKRNTLVVDVGTEIVYRVISDYTSIDMETDKSEGNLKLVGFESQIVTYDHNPTQSEINVIPDDSLVAIYSTTDVPYIPDTQE
jgi:hypothetical protein